MMVMLLLLHPFEFPFYDLSDCPFLLGVPKVQLAEWIAIPLGLVSRITVGRPT